MTNQTIDGVLVSRAALMTVLSEPRPDAPHCVLEARAVLCALLDAPAKEQQWVSVEAFNRVSTELEELKAAQPQVEPVAWIDPICLERMGRQPERNFVVTGQCKSTYSVPLYAEQPAPVAVLPERREPKHYWSRFGKLTGTARVAAEEWCACLDELKRLNGIEP